LTGGILKETAHNRFLVTLDFRCDSELVQLWHTYTHTVRQVESWLKTQCTFHTCSCINKKGISHLNAVEAKYMTTAHMMWEN